MQKIIYFRKAGTMFQNYEFRLQYRINGSDVIHAVGGETEDYAVFTESTENTVRYVLKPKKELELINAYLAGAYAYADNDRVFVNGYQSWTTTREYRKNDIQKGLSGLGKHQPVKYFVEIFGDYKFQNYSNQPGKFHSYSYTYVNSDGKLALFGTTNERTGYTVFHHDMNRGRMLVQKDLEGVKTSEEYAVFELYSTAGTYDEVFDAYFNHLGFPKPRLDHLAGYTSWYNYYGHISEEIILRDLEGLSKVGKHADIFQIDDGYQSKVGDWECNYKTFPSGIRSVVDKIHDKGYLAGVWMAPFSAAFDSRVAQEHPDWLIKVPGTNRNQLGVISWGGGGTLDFYIPEAAEHIKNFFNRVINEWGFDMVKLDFLYSECITPRRGKSRGQIMCEAMDFLRECVGEKTLILGCGVPLFPSFGVVDACRISCDVSKGFGGDFLERNTNRELPSAKNAMNNTMFRRHLNGRVFVNDPDVFYLRKNNLTGEDPLFVNCGKLKFTEEQKDLLAEVNNMCGDVLFVSDNVGGYDEKQLVKAKKYFAKSERKVKDIEYLDDRTVAITYEENGYDYKLTFDVKTGKNKREKL